MVRLIGSLRSQRLEVMWMGTVSVVYTLSALPTGYGEI